MTEVSPLSAGLQSASGFPFSMQQTEEGQGESQLPLHIKEEEADMVEGATEGKPKKELVPLLGVPDVRVEGHEAHYVTKTTKARWDGKRIVKSYGVQLTLLTTVDERRCDVRNC